MKTITFFTGPDFSKAVKLLINASRNEDLTKTKAISLLSKEKLLGPVRALKSMNKEEFEDFLLNNIY